MAKEKLSTDQKVKRSVARTLGNLTFLLIIAAVLGAWGYLGIYTLEPGQAAVLLTFGKHTGTEGQAGLHWSLPPPLVTRTIVNVGELRNEDFGTVGATGAAAGGGAAGAHHDRIDDASMQTSDNNIVRVSFAVQYRIQDPYAAWYRIADLRSVVRSAAAAAMREVVGRMTVDGVLRERRAALTSEVSKILQDILDGYELNVLDIQAVELQDVQPPEAVRGAFDDVVAATQDASRAMNEAEGYRNQVLPSARAEATELLEAAHGYREAQVAKATGEAARFVSVATEYSKAPEVTRKRLYLETMEEVLAPVEKVIIEPGTASVLPYLPLGREGKVAR